MLKILNIAEKDVKLPPPSDYHVWQEIDMNKIGFTTGLNGVELASGKVAELVKSFEHVNEILDGFRYKMQALRVVIAMLIRDQR